MHDSSASSYKVESIGTLGGITIAFGINESGDIVGGSNLNLSPSDSFNSLRNPHAFSWSRSSGIHDLGTLGGSISVATAINNSGIIAGSSEATNPMVSYGFIGTFGGINSIGSLQVAGNSEARGVNSAGVVVGSSGGSAFTWSQSSGMQDIGNLIGGAQIQFTPQTSAYGINDSNVVVGGAQTASGVEHAFIWSPGTGMTDIGTLAGGGSSYALSINNNGAVVGMSDNCGGCGQNGFLWTKEDGMQSLGDLGVPFSFAWDINDFNQIVGASYSSKGQRATLWTKETGLQDINDFVSLSDGSYLYASYGINNHGQIIANGTDGFAYLLTPEIASIPEPDTVWLIVFGLALMLFPHNWDNMRSFH